MLSIHILDGVMDKVLIVDGDEAFLEQTKAGLEKVRQFEVLTAADGRQALSLLSKQPVSVLAADIETPSLDALELLSYMSINHTRTPCIVMTDRGKPWFKKRISQQSFLYHLEKPFQVGSLVSAIFVGLNLRDEGAGAQGMNMATLLPLLELQQKTCRMKVKAAGKRMGFLYFENGEIIDAHCGDLSVQEAAGQIASWNRISFSFSDLPRRRTRRRVKTKLMDFADATWSTSVKPADPQPASDAWGGEERGRRFEEDFEVIDLVEEIEPDQHEPEPGPGDEAEVAQNCREVVKQIASILEQSEETRDFKIIAVVDNSLAFQALQYQGAKKPDTRALTQKLAPFFNTAAPAAKSAGLGPVSGLTLHGENGVLVVQELAVEPGQSPLWSLVLCGPRCNWYFVKTCLESLI